MTPEVINLTNVEIKTQPSLTYRFDIDRKTISGKTDEQESVIQMVRKLLGTERYTYEIYDGSYGTQLQSLIGQPEGYAISETKRIIEESLLTDERIVSVSDFSITHTTLDSMAVSFTVNTIFGSSQITTEVITR